MQQIPIDLSYISGDLGYKVTMFYERTFWLDNQHLQSMFCNQLGKHEPHAAWTIIDRNVAKYITKTANLVIK